MTAAIGLRISTRVAGRRRRGGAIVGAGVGLMRFTGIARTHHPRHDQVEPEPRLASLAIGVGLAAAALLPGASSIAAWRCRSPRFADAGDLRLHFRPWAPYPRAGPHHRLLYLGQERLDAGRSVTAVAVLAILGVAGHDAHHERGQPSARFVIRTSSTQRSRASSWPRMIVVNVNRRFLKLTLNTPDELLGKSHRRHCDRTRWQSGSVRQGQRGPAQTVTGLVVQVESYAGP